MNYTAGQKDPRASDCCANEAQQSTGKVGRAPGLGSSLHENLWRRKRRLQEELAEVDEALQSLNEDTTVQKVIRFLEVAQK